MSRTEGKLERGLPPGPPVGGRGQLPGPRASPGASAGPELKAEPLDSHWTLTELLASVGLTHCPQLQPYILLQGCTTHRSVRCIEDVHANQAGPSLMEPRGASSSWEHVFRQNPGSETAAKTASCRAGCTPTGACFDCAVW